MPKSPRCFTRRQFLRLAGMTSAGFLLQPTTRLAQFAAQTRPANIILVVVDAVRADRLTSYGGARPTSTQLDQWITSQGARFSQAAVVAPWTFMSNAALWTGRIPARMGIHWSTLLPAYATTLPEYLQAAGYFTAGFVTARFVRGSYGFARGFDHYDDSVALATSTETPNVDDLLNDTALAWLANWSGAQPLFLLLYYFDPHTWYAPPPPYDTLYDPDYNGPLTPEVYRDGQEVVAGTLIPTPRDIEHLLALYDGEITHWDACFGDMMAFLDERGLLENSLVAVTSDHGDMFGEHDKWNHTNSLYQELLHVPLLLRYPGHVMAGQVIDTPVQMMDLMPTLLDYANVTPTGPLDAGSLRPLLENQPFSPRDLFSEMNGVTNPSHWAYWIAPRHDLRAVQRGSWKYIHHVGSEADDALYWLNPTSPYETDNLIAAEPALAAELRAAIQAAFPQPGVYLPYLSR